jgi:hypothetical protein
MYGKQFLQSTSWNTFLLAVKGNIPSYSVTSRVASEMKAQNLKIKDLSICCLIRGVTQLGEQ